MSKWEYCYIGQMFDLEEKPAGKPIITFPANQREERSRPIDDFDKEVSRLGVEGWEMIGKVPIPVFAGFTPELHKYSESLWFKRKVKR